MLSLAQEFIACNERLYFTHLLHLENAAQLFAPISPFLDDYMCTVLHDQGSIEERICSVELD